jgi:tubulin monoglycylase TTLL3/8
MMSPSVPAQPEGSDEFDDLLPAYADDSRSDAGVDAVAVPSQPENDKQLLQKPSCCRKLIHQFENELTFHPKLNPVSLRMMHQRINHQPLITRLSEVKRKVHPYDKNLTFSPKLNATSIKLAQQRAGKIHEVQARAANVAAIKVAEFYSEYTFKPAVLTRSIRIAERMDSNFLARQRQYLEKRKQITENHDTFPAKSKQNSPSSKPNQSPLSSTDSKLCNNNSSNTSIKSKQSGCLIQNENQPIVKHINSLKKFRKRSQTAPHLSFGSSPIKPNALLRQNSERLSIATNNEPQPIKKPQNKSSIDHYSGLLQSDFTKLNESERVRRIKVLAEKITRAKKVFQIKGGYRTVRKSLKSRGWVEIDHHNLPNKYTSIKKDNEHQSDSDNDDDDTNEIDSDVEEEESEEYAMLCRAVRNCDPNFIWTLKRCDVLYNYLKKDQTVNHFSGTFFTTKVSITQC